MAVRANEAGLADLETGISGSSTPHLYSPRYGGGRRRSGSYRPIGASPPSPSPRSGGARFFCEPNCDEEPRHFLDACFLCKKSLGGNHDIFMYRGDTPFCSEDCRQEQIDLDEAKERLRNLSFKSARNENQKQNSKPTPQSLHVRAAGTVAAG